MELLSVTKLDGTAHATPVCPPPTPAPPAAADDNAIALQGNVEDWYRLLDSRAELLWQRVPVRPTVPPFSRAAFAPTDWVRAGPLPEGAGPTTTSGWYQPCYDAADPSSHDWPVCSEDRGGWIGAFDTYVSRPPWFQRYVVLHELEHARFQQIRALHSGCSSLYCNELIAYFAVYDLVHANPIARGWLAHGTRPGHPAVEAEVLEALHALTAARTTSYLHRLPSERRCGLLRDLLPRLRSREVSALLPDADDCGQDDVSSKLRAQGYIQ